MPIRYEELIARRIPDVAQTYDRRDTIRYALGLGLGLDRDDPDHLRYVYGHQPAIIPTMAAVLAQERDWYLEPDVGVDFASGVHGEHRLILHAPLPARASVVGKTRVSEVIDKGPGRGAIIVTTNDLFDSDTRAHYASSIQSVFFRKDGGFGGPVSATATPRILPERAPDVSVLQMTSQQTALIYRLSGDENPLHADPAFARSAGFDRPILHGLATFGISAYAVIRTYFAHQPWLMASIGCRFTSPAFSGETMRVEIWRDGRDISFRTVAHEREVTIADHGFVTVTA